MRVEKQVDIISLNCYIMKSILGIIEELISKLTELD